MVSNQLFARPRRELHGLALGAALLCAPLTTWAAEVNLPPSLGRGRRSHEFREYGHRRCPRRCERFRAQQRAHLHQRQSDRYRSV